MRNNSRPGWILGAATLISLGVSGAAQGVILNPGFEALTGPDGIHFSGGKLIDGHLSASANPTSMAQTLVTSDPAPGWTVDTPAGGTMNPTEAYMPGGALGGDHVGWSSGALIYQVLTEQIQPNTRYAVLVNIGRPTVSADDFAYRIILESEGLVKLQDENSVPIAVGTWGEKILFWDSPDVVPADAKLTLNLAADAGVALFDEISDFEGPSGGPLFPEPTAAALLLPLAGTMLRRRRV